MNKSNISIKDVYNLIIKIKQQNPILGRLIEDHIVFKDNAISIHGHEAIVAKILRDVVIIDD